MSDRKERWEGMVEVTQADFAAARAVLYVAQRSETCPVAQALKREFPLASLVSVGTNDFVVYDPYGKEADVRKIRGELWSAAKRIVMLFDMHQWRDKLEAQMPECVPMRGKVFKQS